MIARAIPGYKHHISVCFKNACAPRSAGEGTAFNASLQPNPSTTLSAVECAPTLPNKLMACLKSLMSQSNLFGSWSCLEFPVQIIQSMMSLGI